LDLWKIKARAFALGFCAGGILIAIVLLLAR
jgi:hypothetical protein